MPPGAKYHGKTYGEWSAVFWHYALAQPIEGHLFLDTPEFDFGSGQKGDVGFVDAADRPLTRHVTLLSRKALFLTIREVEPSTLEEPPLCGATEAAQRANIALPSRRPPSERTLTPPMRSVPTGGETRSAPDRPQES